MNMSSRNQYLQEVKKEYLKASRRVKSSLLNEAGARTGLSRKHLIVKLRLGSWLKPRPRKKRQEYYDSYLRTALVRVWQIFDYPCGQRLEPLLKSETENLRRLGELSCSDETAKKLQEITFSTIDLKLRHQKEVERINRKYHRKIHPLLYKKIPVKLADDWNRFQLGNIQVDLVEHCGQSAQGDYLNTISNADIATGWWEGEAIMGRGQIPTQQGLDRARQRFHFAWREIHSDNGTEFINAHLFRYTQQENLGFSRSRPNKKNDNCFVEQKNWTHVKKFVGYLRYDSLKEQEILNDLYGRELRLYKNFFQPVIKLVSKQRVGGKIHRQYNRAKTPYQRVIESSEVSPEEKQELTRTYQSLNPAELKRNIDLKLDKLYQVYQAKHQLQTPRPFKRLTPCLVRKYIIQPTPVLVR